MFYAGKHYDVKPVSNLFKLALAEWIDAHLRDSVELVQFLADHLVPDLAEKVTDANKAEILRSIDLHHSDPERARILEVKRAREWEAAHD